MCIEGGEGGAPVRSIASLPSRPDSRYNITVPTEPSVRDYFVWSARGGHGGTTIAGALAHIWGTPLQGNIDDEHKWVFGPRQRNPRVGEILVTDAGPLQTSPGSSGTNVVVLRGPSTVGLRTLSTTVVPIDHLIVIREPWRAISNARVQEVLGIPIAAELTFSERISRLADAGLLGTRLSKLDEFADLRRWAWTQVCGSRLRLQSREQGTRCA